MRRSKGLGESGKDRRALAADAGFGSLSIGSVLAGALVAYGGFAVLIGVAAAIVDALNVKADILTSDYEQLGIVGGLIVAGILLVSYLFGGYVAGRMARRAGVLNGLLVAVLGLAIAAAVAALIRSSSVETINTNLRSLGVPTTADEYGQAFTVAGIASLAAILIGSLIGGALGEQWHGKLLARAVNPAIGTEAEARKRAQSDMAKAEQERTLAFERARTTSPSRSRRVDRDALSAADRKVLDDDDGHESRPPADVVAASTGRKGNGEGHNGAGGGGRFLTGRVAPAEARAEDSVFRSRTAAIDPVIPDARGQGSLEGADTGIGAPGPGPSGHRRFRRRQNRLDP